MTMASKLFSVFLLAVIVAVAAQSEDELHIPVENDNRFPPENHSEVDVIEGSGAGVIEEPIELTTIAFPPLIEDVNKNVVENEDVKISSDSSCPKPCVCSIEGDSNNFITDCSGYGLTAFPTPLDPRTTTLNVQNNKLTEIPRGVSELKSLKVLNANDNSIMDLVSGSISELPELIVLKLANNRLIEYPQDLKNGFGLTKLREIDLGGNDMRTPLTRDTFSNFKSLRKLTLPTSTQDIVDDLCEALQNSLETICTVSCTKQSFECPNAPHNIDENTIGEIIIVTPESKSLPSVIETTGINLTETPTVKSDNVSQSDDFSHISMDNNAVQNILEQNVINTELKEAAGSAKLDNKIGDENLSGTNAAQNDRDNIFDAVLPGTIALSSLFFANDGTQDKQKEIGSTNIPNISNDKVDEFSLRSAVNEAPQDTQQTNQTAEQEGINVGSDVSIGATTSNSKSGGVDKSVIGIIVAGMIVVVAGITIKKNWNSIKNRFSSSPQAPNDRERAVNTNGTTAPEEVPLQDKSPV